MTHEVLDDTQPGAPVLGLVAERSKESKKILDLLFCIDTTGSMGSWIASAKQIGCDTIKEFQKHPTYNGWQFRLGFIGFNDWDPAKYTKGSYLLDGYPTLEIVDFTENVDTVKDKIMGIQAVGGHDSPEDVTSAFKFATTKLNWMGDARIMIFMCDALPHGKQFHPLGQIIGDNFPNGDPANETASSTINYVKQLARIGVDFTFILIDKNMSSETHKLFEKAYEESIEESPNSGTFKTVEMVQSQKTYEYESVPYHVIDRSCDYDDDDMDRSCDYVDDDMDRSLPSSLPSLMPIASDRTLSLAIVSSIDNAISRPRNTESCEAPL